MVMALEGTRVLDLSRLLPGPFCTMILADMGAEVIKIEEIDGRGGMVGRDMLTPPGLTPEEEERWLAHNSLARNKKSLALDLRHEEGKRIFCELVPTVDVLVEGYRPGVAHSLGVDYASVAKVNPRIVYCSISGYGQDGPYRDLPGHNANFCSVAGIVGLGGWAKSAVLPGFAPADIGGGLHAVIGILCALMARQRTGKGQYIDIALADCALSYVLLRLSLYLVTGTVFHLPSSWVVQNIWETAEGGSITTANIEPHFWRRFCHALGREELVSASRATGKELDEAYSAISEILLTKTRDEWVRDLREADTCVAPVLTIPEVAGDPHFLHREMIVNLDHPAVGEVRQMGIAIKLSETPGRIRSFAPRLGQHTEEILKGLGYPEEYIAKLREKGVIKTNLDT